MTISQIVVRPNFVEKQSQVITKLEDEDGWLRDEIARIMKNLAG